MEQTATLLLFGKPNEKVESPAQIEVWSKAKRNGQAAASFFGCLVLAAVTVFVPLLHFFLVPGFLIAAPVSAYLLSRREGKIVHAETRCPSCANPIDVDGIPLKFPVYRRCAQCAQVVLIERASS